MLPSGVDWLIFLGSLGFSACLVPQMIRTIKLGRADDISLWFLVTVIVAAALSLSYFLIEDAGWFVWYGYVATIAAWLLVLWYRLRPRPGSLGHETPREP